MNQMLSLNQKPVYPDYFADPFVLAHNGKYYAYGTGLGLQPNQRFFELLVSDNLINWQSHGGVLEPLTTGETDYWAPEVAFFDNLFYMYYSSGFGDQQRLRVATSSVPEGPFTDAGLYLTPHEPFSIDANPFRDDDGTWYLFYCKDFLEGERVGTAIVVDQLQTMTRLKGHASLVVRANHDWQIYQRNRLIYGEKHDWHTVEGAFVIKHQNQYYCFYSGGAWFEPSYGVSYAVAPHPLGPWSEPESGKPAILQTIENQLIGPGHNSIIRRDNTDYIVYHAWDKHKTARQMYISRLEWQGYLPRVQ
jgi:GH43 family beta-xylosidase